MSATEASTGPLGGESDTNFNTNTNMCHQVAATESEENLPASTSCFYTCHSDLKLNAATLEPNAMPGPKKVIVMRHGERVDDLFPCWVQYCQAKGRYDPFDNNMPASLEPLTRSLRCYVEDTPLTQMGNVLAQMVGRGLFVNDLVPDAIYCSPSLRCVQTAATVSSSAQATCKIRIEPGLFENNDSYPTVQPQWVSPEDLSIAGFNIDLDYKPYSTHERIWKHTDNSSSYNKRMHAVFDVILGLEAMNNPHGNVLIAAHASTVDLASGYFAIPRRKLVDRDLYGIADRVPYCNTAVFTRQNDFESAPYGIWMYEGESGLPQITYKNFSSRANYKFLMRKYNSKDWM